VPHHATESWNTTVPNKLFDYMSKGKPVIVSNAKPVERIVREEQCGIVFKDRDSEDLARAIVTLKPESIRTAMGQRGRDAIARKYNWAIDEQRLCNALEAVVVGKS
jgi:glycosyltransferase involved in cell wall biosynthesis